MSFPAAPKSLSPVPLSSEELAQREQKQQIYLTARNRAFDILYVEIVRRFTDSKKHTVPHDDLHSTLLSKWQEKRSTWEHLSPDSRKQMQISSTANWQQRIHDDLLSQEDDIERPLFFCKKDQQEKNIIFTPTSILTRHRSEFRDYVSSKAYIPPQISLLIFDLKKNNQRVDYAFRFIFTLNHDQHSCPDWDN